MTDTENEMDEPLFGSDDEEEENSGFIDPKEMGWRVLIVDDDPEIHNVTTFSLKKFEYQGRPLHFLHAYTGAEAKKIMGEVQDIALVILDVVMETTHSGLDLAKWIRQVHGNDTVRIVLRTGQPGEAPEREVIVDYDINDYKEKSELTSTKLFVLVCTALRSYRAIASVKKNLSGLQKIVASTATLFDYDSFDTFLSGMLDQFSTLFFVQHGLTYSIEGGFAAHQTDLKWQIVAATGKYSEKIGGDPELLIDVPINDLFDGERNVRNLGNGVTCLVINVNNRRRAALFIFGLMEFDSIEWALAELFVRNATVAGEKLMMIKQIEETQREIAFRLGQITESRSDELANHVKRMSLMSAHLAEEMGLSRNTVDMIEVASALHDVGKVAIPDAILNKPAKLTPEEWQIMKSHAQAGYDVLEGSELDLLDMAGDIAIGHHEKWDGSGYPNGIKGEQIPITARIVAAGDVFDALINNRVYKNSWTKEKVREYFLEQSGSQFDPQVVDAVMKKFDALMSIKRDYPD